MNITAKGFTIEMTHDELWDVAWDIRRALEHTLRNHWINHQENWIQNEKTRIERLRYMFNALGRTDLAEDIFRIATDVFKEFNDKKICGQ